MKLREDDGAFLPSYTVRRLVGVVGLFVVSVLAPASAAVAHSGLAAASPGPGSVVGGEIDEIQLLYADIIVSIDGSVTAPDGNVVDATFVMNSDIEATVELAARLDQAGEYAVRHEVLSVDGDPVDGAFLFTFDPDAPAPQLVFVPEDDGLAWYVWAIIGIGLVVIVVLAWRLVGSIRRQRATHPLSDTR